MEGQFDTLDTKKLERGAFQTREEAVQVQMTVEEIFFALENSFPFFINFYLGDELTSEVPEFHNETWDLFTLEIAIYVAIALPRGHAKTTLAKLVVVWFFLFTDFRFCVYIGNVLGAAAEQCQDIVNYVLCRNHIAVFGEPEFKVQQEGKGFYKFWLTLPHKLDSEGRPTRKFCILKAFGVGMKVRGMNIDNQRPELVILDDVEDDENTATPALVKKLFTWFYGPFLKAMSQRRKKLIFLGNLISNVGLLNHLLESDMWYTMRKGCLLADGTPLWPELWPIEAIRADFKEYQRAKMTGRWFAEMMNIPMSDSSPLVAEEDIYYRPWAQPDECEMAFITVDTAISEKTWADKSAVAVHGYVRGAWQIVDHVSMRMEPDRLFFVIKEMCVKWNTRVVGIEETTLQKALAFLFDVLQHMHQFTFTTIPLPHGNVRKVDRLAVWTGAMKQKIYGINEGDLVITEQLLRFDPEKQKNDDDLIDACAMGMPMIQNYMNYILQDHTIEDEDVGIQSDYASQGI